MARTPFFVGFRAAASTRPARSVLDAASHGFALKRRSLIVLYASNPNREPD
jgi:hypothetical protein